MPIETEISALVDKVRETIRNEGRDQTVGLDALSVIHLAAREPENTYTVVKTKIREYLRLTDLWKTQLEGLLRDVEGLEVRRERLERYGPQWWRRRHAALGDTFRENPETGLEQWLQTYTDALLAWELDVCNKLVHEPYAFPAFFVNDLELVRNGTLSIIDKDYPQALEMLKFLVQMKVQNQSKLALDDLSRSILLVFIGRIYLYRLSQTQEAQAYFEQANALAPEHGLPSAALGESRRPQDVDQALPFFQQALTKSPALPDGYIGMGLYFEDEKAWEDADEWYQKASGVLQDERAPLTTVRKLLAPVTGNAFLQMARFFQKGEPQVALHAVGLALEIGVKGKGKYTERFAYRLKGEIEEQLDQRTNAAEAYYEAGRRYLWCGEIDTAANLLERAKLLDPEHAPTYWFLMEALRILSYQETPPHVNVESVHASIRAWEAGIQIAEPGPAFAWTYGRRALLNELLEDQPNADTANLRWEAVTYLERGLLVSGNDSDNYAFLGKFHGKLLNHACALDATQKAVDLDPKNAMALEERIVILSNIGERTAALELVEQRRQLDSEPNAWLDSVKAFNLLLTGPHSEALVLLNNTLSVAPDDLWRLELRATCYRMMDDWIKAARDSQRIWSRYDQRETSNQSTFAWAAYYVGEFASARRVFERMLAIPTKAGDAHRGLGCCALGLGEFESAELHLGIGIVQAAVVRELDELLFSEFKSTEHMAADWPHGVKVREILARFAEKVRSRRTELEVPASAESELRGVIAALPQGGTADSWSWVGAHAGLARLQIAAERSYDAAVTYHSLLKEGKRFPESRIGFANSIDKLRAASGERLRAGEKHEALKQLTAASALTTLSLADHGTLRAELSCSLAMTYFSVPNQAEARVHFVQALQSYRAAGSDSPGGRLAMACRPLILNPSQYWLLMDEWYSMTKAPEIDAPDRTDLSVAISSSAPYLDDAFRLTTTTTLEVLLPIVIPIVLEVGDHLVPKVDSRQDGGKFLYEDIPAIRNRIETRLGVRVPGVRARTYVGEANANNYQIMLDEVIVDLGSVQMDMCYCPVPVDMLEGIGIPTSSIIPAPNPTSYEAGGWIPSHLTETVVRHGLAVWTETGFIIAHLEAILQDNLVMFLGVQEVGTLVDEWRKTPDGASLIPDVWNNPVSRLQFVRLLQALVKEQVPIVAWKQVLEVVRETGLEDLVRATRAVRLRLKRQLPGNGSAFVRLEVPTEWERWLSHENGRAIFAVSPREAHDLLAMVRGWMQSKQDSLHVLITRNPELRPFVRRLVETEFPRLAVLAQEETLSSEELESQVRIPRSSPS
jgi:tetratricopeptide (TPR) repeat protein